MEFRSATACGKVIPAFTCPNVIKTQRLPREFRSFCAFSWPALTMGTKKSGLKNTKVPWNPGGATPTMVNGCLLS